MLEFKDVKVEYRGGTAGPVSFCIEDGGRCCVLSPGGGTNTGLLLAALGLSRVTGGYASIDGEVVDGRSAPYLRRISAYAPQDLSLPFANLSELANALAATAPHKERKHAGQRIRRAWETAGIGGTHHADPLETLTGETLRMATVLAATALRRRVVVLDMPLAGLGEESKKAVAAAIREAAEAGAAVLSSATEEEDAALLGMVIRIGWQT